MFLSESEDLIVKTTNFIIFPFLLVKMLTWLISILIFPISFRLFLLDCFEILINISCLIHLDFGRTSPTQFVGSLTNGESFVDVSSRFTITQLCTKLCLHTSEKDEITRVSIFLSFTHVTSCQESTNASRYYLRLYIWTNRVIHHLY